MKFGAQHNRTWWNMKTKNIWIVIHISNPFWNGGGGYITPNWSYISFAAFSLLKSVKLLMTSEFKRSNKLRIFFWHPIFISKFKTNTKLRWCLQKNKWTLARLSILFSRFGNVQYLSQLWSNTINKCIMTETEIITHTDQEKQAYRLMYPTMQEHTALPTCQIIFRLGKYGDR